MKPESVSVIVYDANITLTILKIICNYIRDTFGDTFGERVILPE